MTTPILLENRCHLPGQTVIFACIANAAHNTCLQQHAIVWKSFSHLGKGSRARFTWGKDMAIRATWSQGQCRSQALPTRAGQSFQLADSPSGRVLRYHDQSPHPSDISLETLVGEGGGIRAELLMDGSPALLSPVLAKDQRCFFAPLPKLWLGLAIQAPPGCPLSQIRMVSRDLSSFDCFPEEEKYIYLEGNLQSGFSFKEQKGRFSHSTPPIS